MRGAEVRCRTGTRDCLNSSSAIGDWETEPEEVDCGKPWCLLVLSENPRLTVFGMWSYISIKGIAVRKGRVLSSGPGLLEATLSSRFN